MGKTKAGIFLMHWSARLSRVDAHKWSHDFHQDSFVSSSCVTFGLICGKTLHCFLVCVENLIIFLVDLWMGALRNTF